MPIANADRSSRVRLSLAGTTDKLPVLWDGGSVGITRGRPPSTHIVKTPIRGVLDMVANEAYCLSLAAAAGLPAAVATPLAPGEQEALLVRRYDRLQDADGEVHRVHQEDVCQALGFVPAEKYEADGGPGVAASAALLREHSAAPAADLGLSRRAPLQPGDRQLRCPRQELLAAAGGRGSAPSPALRPAVDPRLPGAAQSQDAR